MARATLLAVALMATACTIQTAAPTTPSPAQGQPGVPAEPAAQGDGELEPTAGPPGTHVSLLGDFSRYASDQLQVIFTGSQPVKPGRIEPDAIIVEVPTTAQSGSVAVYAGQQEVWRGNFAVTGSDDALLVATADGAGLLGAVYRLANGTSSLPDFDALGRPHATIVVPALQIAPRRFDAGFPGLIGQGEPLLEWFAIRFVGKLIAPTDGTYAFRVLSDDGAKVYVDGQLLVDNDGVHPPRNSRAGHTDLSAGPHDLVVEYFQGPRYEIALELRWQVPGQAEELIPPGAFSRR